MTTTPYPSPFPNYFWGLVHKLSINTQIISYPHILRYLQELFNYLPFILCINKINRLQTLFRYSLNWWIFFLKKYIYFIVYRPQNMASYWTINVSLPLSCPLTTKHAHLVPIACEGNLSYGFPNNKSKYARETKWTKIWVALISYLVLHVAWSMYRKICQRIFQIFSPTSTHDTSINWQCY